MNRHYLAFTSLILLVGWSDPYRLVYSNGFSFSNYDFLVIAKPDPATAAPLYGMDIEIANKVSRSDIKVIGEKEFQSLTPAQKQRTLFARMSLASNPHDVNDDLISVAFDDATSGKTEASVTGRTKGDMFDTTERTKAFESVSNAIIQAVERDKSLRAQDQKQK